MKVALVAPAATVTPAGTDAAASELESETTMPPVGAAPERVTVPADDEPPVTLVGERLTVESDTGPEVFTVRAAVRVIPPRVAVIVTAVDAATEVVVTGNWTLDEPTGTETLAGTVAAASLLARLTMTQHADTVPPTVTVPVEVPPPVTVVGLSARAERAGPGGGGLTFKVLVLDTPSAVAVTIANCPCVGSDVVEAAKVALVAPAGTVTLAGTLTHVVLLDDNVTTLPPAGATPPSVTVPVEPPVPIAGFGLNASAESVPGGSTSSGCTFIELRVATIVTEVEVVTGCVVTVKVVLLAPCGIVTLGGTDATAGLVLPRCTIAPPGPAMKPMPAVATVACTVPPPCTVGALSVNGPSSRIGSDGETASHHACDAPPYDPMIEELTTVRASTDVAAKVALVAPAGTVTLGGTPTRAGYWLARVTTAPRRL